jgi:hypothetical protein
MGRPTGSRDGNQTDSAQRRPGLCILLSFQVPDLQIPDSQVPGIRGLQGSSRPSLRIAIVHGVDMVSLELPMD